MQSILVTPPASPSGLIVTLDEARDQVRAEGTDEDSLLLVYIASAQAEIERRLGRVLTAQTWKLTLDTFPAGSSPILVPRPPLTAVSSVVYTDVNGASQTLSGHVVDSSSEPGRIYPPETGWPSTYDRAWPAVTVTYTCGHTSTRPVDPMLKSIALMLIGRAYENREESITGTVVARLPFVYEYLNGHPGRDWTDYSVQR